MVDEVMVTGSVDVDWAVALYGGPAKTALRGVEVKMMDCAAMPT